MHSEQGTAIRIQVGWQVSTSSEFLTKQSEQLNKDKLKLSNCVVSSVILFADIRKTFDHKQLNVCMSFKMHNLANKKPSYLV